MFGDEAKPRHQTSVPYLMEEPLCSLAKKDDPDW
jgi:hypothetical protein